MKKIKVTNKTRAVKRIRDMKKIAFKFGYVGTAFQGFQRQAGTSLRTVEGEIVRALREAGGFSTGDLCFRSAGRTDRDVSAVANCCSFRCSLRPVETAGMLNAKVKGVFFHSYAPVGRYFNPRHAASRHYRYYFPPFFRASVTADAPRPFVERLVEILKVFKGKHDFSSFARLEEGRSPLRRVRHISGSVLETHSPGPGMGPGRDTVCVDIVGESFLWHQVRRMIGAAVSVCAGKLEPEEIQDALENPGNGINAVAMPPRYLVLMDVHYANLEFQAAEVRGAGASLMPPWLAERSDSARFETFLLDGFGSH